MAASSIVIATVVTWIAIRLSDFVRRERINKVASTLLSWEPEDVRHHIWRMNARKDVGLITEREQELLAACWENLRIRGENFSG